MPQTNATSICCITNHACKERGERNYDELNRAIMHKYININNGTLIIEKFLELRRYGDQIGNNVSEQLLQNKTKSNGVIVRGLCG